MDQKPKSEISSPNLEKIPRSAAENKYDIGNLVNSQGVAAQPPEPILPEAMKVGSESKPVAEELRESRDLSHEGGGELTREEGVLGCIYKKARVRYLKFPMAKDNVLDEETESDYYFSATKLILL
ncbi:protein TIME FOR COFFEE [Forsythia ovata]|uniref:Protein TIME FOR COFFEE n=1 Tax=Forsythia ovata TaxID=205694 RepID=A0ABD1VF75_9LAMI